MELENNYNLYLFFESSCYNCGFWSPHDLMDWYFFRLYFQKELIDILLLHWSDTAPKCRYWCWNGIKTNSKKGEIKENLFRGHHHLVKSNNTTVSLFWLLNLCDLGTTSVMDAASVLKWSVMISHRCAFRPDTLQPHRMCIYFIFLSVEESQENSPLLNPPLSATHTRSRMHKLTV